MENHSKREIIVQKVEKFDNYIFDVKILNRIIAIFFALFLLCFFVFDTKIKERETLENQRYERMLAELEARQLNLIYNQTTPNSGNGNPNVELEKSMFRNAIDANIYAFNKLKSYSTFEIESKGVTDSSAAGQNVEIKMNSISVKYSNGIVYNKTVRKETKTDFGQTDGTETVYTGTAKYVRRGENIRQEGDIYVADFSEKFEKQNSEVLSYAYYEINEKTVLSSKSFSFVRNPDGTIAYYKATIICDSKGATVKYAKEIQEQGGTSYPDVSYLEISSIIDRDGNLLSYNIHETMTMVKTIIIPITATANNDITYIVVSHDETPKTPMPNYLS